MADEKTPDTKPSPAREQKRVKLYLKQPHTRFELRHLGLPDLVPEGTSYTVQEADTVLALCRKYRVRCSRTP